MAKKSLIGYQATDDEVARLDEHWKKAGAQSRSLFLRELVERELTGGSPPMAPSAPPPPHPCASPPPPPPFPMDDLRDELAALAYLLLACWQKAPDSASAKSLVQKFLLSGVAKEQIKGGE